MASKKEIKENLEKVLREIGTIKPWFDNSVNEWIFCHPDYPVEYGGKTALDVIRNYPKYLQEFIKQRLDGKLNPLTEQKTTGHGGKRIGAGRPTGSTKEIRQRINLPIDLVNWYKNNPAAIELTRELMLHQTHESNKNSENEKRK